MLLLLGVAVIAFFSTKIDDLFFLMIFFGDRWYRPRDIAAGEYAGTITLCGISLACSLASLV
ncbi:MAG TPA: quaternary ammonium transporter, partial [bacterium]|nr:quaternary ammonium transporter [bacterium]